MSKQKSGLLKILRGKYFFAWCIFNSSLASLEICIKLPLLQEICSMPVQFFGQQTNTCFYHCLFFPPLISEFESGTAENEDPPPLPPHPSEKLFTDYNHRSEDVYYF